jgi:biopolymer transport protein ExbB
MFHFLQVTDTVTQTAAAATDANKDGSISLVELLTLGGWIMIPLGVLFVATIFVFFERLIAIRKASKIEGNFMNIIRDHIVNGNVTAARSFAKNTANPVARIIDKGIQRLGKPIDAIEKRMWASWNCIIWSATCLYCH